MKMNCDFQKTDEKHRNGKPLWRCKKCGRRLVSETGVARSACREMGLGDRVAAAIKAVTKFFGKEIKPCGGCKKRREWLNKIG